LNKSRSAKTQKSIISGKMRLRINPLNPLAAVELMKSSHINHRLGLKNKAGK
jgi:hypothetical protein